MNKREYIQANKDWLEAKSKEEGVKALPKGIGLLPCCRCTSATNGKYTFLPKWAMANSHSPAFLVAPHSSLK